MKLRDVYAEYLANWLSGGSLINRDKISLLGIKTLYDRYLTNGYITKVWCVTAVPVYFNKNLTQAIRNEMSRLHPRVITLVSTYNTPVNLNVTDDVFVRQMKRASAAYNKYSEVFDQLSDDEKLTGSVQYDNAGHKSYVNASTLAAIKETYDSYRYAYKESIEGSQFFETYYFVHASAKSRRELKAYKKSLMALFSSNEISYVELHGDITRYLSNFGPAVYLHEQDRKITPMLMSQDNLAAFMPYKTKGLIGDRGILIGMDWQVKLPFWLDFFGSGSAQVIMALAKSGWGKTQLMFFIAMMMIGADVHCSVTDIKGGEWNKLLQFVKGTVISMDGANARFVNTLRLDDLECTLDDCEEAFNMAVRDTITLYSIMVNLQPNEGNEADLDMILEQAVMKMYNHLDVVKNNPSTFKRTESMKLGDVLEVVEGLSSTNSYTEEQVKLCTLIRTRLAAFFRSEGRYKEAFINEITTGEVIKTPLIIYSFNKNSGTMLDNLDTIRVFMAQALDNRKTVRRKREHLHTAAFYEELQRSAQFGRLVETISHRVTGSRSDNVTVFLLLNAISTFDNREFAAIKSNITTVMAGKLIDDDIDVLVNDFGCKPIEGYLRHINDAKNEKYRNCFAVNYDTGYTSNKAIIKAVFPQEIIDKLKTRDEVKDEL